MKNLKKKSKFTCCSVQTESTKVGAWTAVAPGFTCRQTSERRSPGFVLLPPEMLRFSPCHPTPHSWVIGSPEWYRGFLGLGIVDFFFFFSFSFFFFFALLLENEIFSSFLRNKLVNKFILFCFSFPQSFIFNPIPFRLHSFPLLLPGVDAIGLLSCCRSQQALSTRGLHLLISSCFFCKLVNKLN